MGRSSKRWISEHRRDAYVKKARQENYRSRAAFKLIQIQKRFKLMCKGDVVLDLGAAPGGWSQVAVGMVGQKGCVVAVDLLKIEPIPGVRVLQGDILEKETHEKILAELKNNKADLVLSDMAPNTSGIASLDHDRSILLMESVLDLLPLLLRHGGSIVIKVFQGKELNALKIKALSFFEDIKVFKPEASRSKSAEVYLVGKGFRQISLS